MGTDGRRLHGGVVLLGVAFGVLVGANSADGAAVVTDAPAFVIALDAADNIAVDCDGGAVRVTVNAVPSTFSTACAAVTSLEVTGAGAFANTVDLSLMTATAFPIVGAITVRPGPGADTMIGGPLAETFVWNPGDGSDVVDGNGGADVLVFNGAGAAEIFTITPQGSRFRLFRNVGNITMDVGTVPTLSLAALGADDIVNTTGLAGVTQLLDGGDSGGDVLNYDANGQCARQSTGVISQAGFGSVFFTGFAEVNLLDGICPAPALGAGPWLLLAGLLTLFGMWATGRKPRRNATA
jgi:hypothetical protein